jgi:hypothetical protein
VRSDAGYFREEPGAGNPHARIREGEAEWPSYSADPVALLDPQHSGRSDPTMVPTVHAAEVVPAGWTRRPGVLDNVDLGSILPSPGGHGFEVLDRLFATAAYIGLPADEVHESGNRLSALHLLSHRRGIPAVPVSNHDV